MSIRELLTMKQLSFSILLVVILVCLWDATTVTGDGGKITDPICVVGGGLSGLIVSHMLQDRLDGCPCYGTSLRLFEQSPDHFGGKLDTFTTADGYNVWEKGPIIFTEDDTLLLKYLRMYDMDNLFTWKSNSFAAFDPDTAETVVMERLVPPNAVDALLAAIRRYYKIREDYPSAWFTPSGFAKIHTLRKSHPDLFLSAADWLATKQLTILTTEFTMVFSCEGYGDLASLPALYMLKFLTPARAWRLLRFPITPPGDNSSQMVTVNFQGFREFAHRIADKLPNKKLGVRLVDMDRGNPSSLLTFVTGETSLEEDVFCSWVVLAFPPLLANLERIMDDLSFEEKSLLNDIHVHKYVTSGHIVKANPDRYVFLGVLNGSLPGLGPQGNGGPIAVVMSGKVHLEQTHATTVYSWLYGKFGSGPTREDKALVAERLFEFLDKFNTLPQGGEMTFLKGFEYFPHVSNGSIADGFFARFETLQGKGGLFYASPLITFEALDPTIEMAEYIAAKVWKSLPVPQECYDKKQCV